MKTGALKGVPMLEKKQPDFFLIFNIKVGDFNSRNHLTYPNDWLQYKLTYNEMVSSIHVSFFLTVNDLIGTYQKHIDT